MLLTQTEEGKKKKNTERERMKNETAAKIEVLTTQLQRIGRKREVRHSASTTEPIAVESELANIDKKHDGATMPR